jgi:hypothetical protein
MPINNTLPPTNIPAGVTKQTKKTTGVSGSWGAPANPVKKSAPVAGVIPTPTTSAYTPPSVNQNTQRGIVPLSAPITKPQNITTPSGMQVSGNPGTWTGGQPAQEQKFNQPVQGLFGNVAQSLANRSYEGSPELNSVAEQLRQSAAANEAIGQRAAKIAEEYGKQYANVGRLGANAEAGYISTGISPVAQGSAAVIARNTAAQQQAIAQGMQAALEGTGQQLTAQQQLSAALNQAGGLYGQQQQLTQSGLESAGSLTQPQFPSYQNLPFDPVTGQYGGGGTGGMVGRAAQVGQIEAARSNAQQQGTAGVDIARQGLERTTNEYNNMVNTASNAVGQSNRVKQILDTTKLNDGSLVPGNVALNYFMDKTSDPNFTGLQTALNEAMTFYQAVLGSRGVTPSDSGALARNVLDITKSKDAIKASIAELDAAVARTLQSKEQERNNYAQNLQGGNQSGAQVDPLGIR